MATMKPTLLEMTQNILSAMDSDEVNSISDTAESLQVARAIQQTYWNMLGKYDLPEHNTLIKLEASEDNTTPCLMYRPEGCTRIEWIKYYDSNPMNSLQVSQYGSYSHGVNTDIVRSQWSTTSTTSITIGTGTKTFTVDSDTLNVTLGQDVTIESGLNWMTGTLTSYSSFTMVVEVTSTQGSGTFSAWTVFSGSANAIPGYKNVKILSLQDFLNEVNSFSLLDNNVASQTISVLDPATGVYNTFNFRYKTDRQPCYCTIFANNYIVFDSYDSTQDTTLQQDKTQAWAWMYPTFELEDDFVPNLDAQQFPLLFNDAKALVFFEQKQYPHAKAEEEVDRQRTAMQKWKAVKGKISPEADMFFKELPNFAR